MTLAEKITALRGERKLSQGDLAERLDVSRQSVGKWETGQAVPELDKIIRLADLFGVTVDELVRDGDAPRPQPPQGEAPCAPEPGREAVYMLPWKLAPGQALGILLIAGGLLMMMLAAFVGGDPLLFIGGTLAVFGVPLLLAKKHGFLIDGWMGWTAGYVLLHTPVMMGRWYSPLWGFRLMWMALNTTGSFSPPVMLLFYLAYFAVAVLSILLPVYTVYLCWKKRKGRKEDAPPHKKRPLPSAGAASYFSPGVRRPQGRGAGRSTPAG